jgi:3-isopropylmalate/(R)-2-methylmalate dehydratase small subunit
MNEPFEDFSGRVAVLPIDNIDTDQIIPARFLKTTAKQGLDEHLFQDWRYEADGSPKPDFILNKPESKGAVLLLAGDNFGCGSSREHAPWALQQYGFRGVISTSFVELADQRLILPDGTRVEFPIDEFSKACILAGVDELGFILSQEKAIQAYESGHPVSLRTTSA